MDILWAPWRMEYIENVCVDKDCIFCTKPKERADRQNLIVFRGKSCFIIMNRYPYNNGHLLVVPYKHTCSMNDLTTQEVFELFELIRQSCNVLTDLFNAQGFNIGMNVGRIAGAGIDDHLHFHVVPRWSGDTNFMPVTGHTKIVSEGLEQTWEKLYTCMKQRYGE